jgi:gamma-glutamyltranspeptidase/glutathione hydrolase
MAPAIALAREGIIVTPHLARSLERHRKRLAKNRAAAAIFLKADGSVPHAGDKLVQADLAWTLERIAEHGAAAFYEGAIAARIVEDMRANGGLVTLADLKAYKPLEREPVRGTYRDYEIRSMPPPSSGGVHLVQLLNILEGYQLRSLGHNSVDTIHLMAEAMKLAYADRSRHLGDPERWQVPLGRLTSKQYASMLRHRIDMNRATPSEHVRQSDPIPDESNETTHFSVMDGAGNVVSNTYTINLNYGSGIVAAGTGILLNNEMDDFSAKPGVPNAYGLVGGEANAVGPGKRPLSSMTPTIIFKNGVPFLATGSLGGSRIITTTLQVIVNIIDYGMDVAAATVAPRMHHQWQPDELWVEEGLASEHTLDLLRARGHQIVVKKSIGSTQSVLRMPPRFLGASDPRSPGALTLGY